MSARSVDLSQSPALNFYNQTVTSVANHTFEFVNHLQLNDDNENWLRAAKLVAAIAMCVTIVPIPALWTIRQGVNVCSWGAQKVTDMFNWCKQRCSRSAASSIPKAPPIGPGQGAKVDSPRDSERSYVAPKTDEFKERS